MWVHERLVNFTLTNNFKPFGTAITKLQKQ